MAKYSLNDIIRELNKTFFDSDPTQLISNDIIDKTLEIVQNRNDLGDVETKSDFNSVLLKLVNTELRKINESKENEYISDAEIKAKTKQITEDILEDSEFLSTLRSDFAHAARVSRYQQYDYLVKSIGRLRRAITVMASNILSPDYVSKDIGDFSYDEEFIIGDYSEDEISERYKNLDKYLIKLDKIADLIITKTLKYGDCFVELVDIKEEVLRKKKLLMLSSEAEKYKKAQKIHTKISENLLSKEEFNIVLEYKEYNKEKDEYEKKILNKKLEILLEMPEASPENLIMDSIEDQELSILVMEAKKKKKDDDIDEEEKFIDLTQNPNDIKTVNKVLKQTSEEVAEVFEDLKKVAKRQKGKVRTNFNKYSINIIDPTQVIKIGTKNISFGYLVFPKEYTPFIGQTSSPIDLVKKGSSQIKLTDGKIVNQTTSVKAMFVKKIYEKIKKILKDKFGDIIDEMNFSEIKSLNSILAAFIEYNDAINSLDTSELLRLKLKYVPESKMVHFKIDEDEYSPYGTSVLEPVLFDSKMLLAIKVANTMDAIANSRDNLLITFDIDYSNDVAEYMQAVKRKLRQTKVLFGDDLSVDAIPSMISNFEAFYLPRKEDKTYIDMTYLPKKDTSMNPDLLKYQRDETISGLDIPPPYLGIEENIESKSTLAFENVIFASTILRKQKEFNNLFTELYRKAYRLVYDEVDISCSFELRPPLLLIVYTIIDLINNFSNVYDFLTQNLGLAEEDVVKEFMPYLNKFFDFGKLMEKKIDKIISGTQQNQQEQGGEMPGF